MTQTCEIHRAVTWLAERCDAYNEADVAEYGDRVFDSMVGRVRPLADDPTLSRDTRVAVAESIRQLVRTTLPSDHPPDSASPRGMLGLARVTAQREMELADLLQIYRAGQAAFWRRWLADVTARIPDRHLLTAVLDRSWEQLDGWCEHQISGLSKVFLDERSAWVNSALAQRTQLVHAILAGTEVGVDDASVVLRHELRRIQTAVILWAPDHERLNAQAPVEVRRDIARRLGATTAVIVPRGSSEQWLWFATDRLPGLDDLEDMPSMAAHPQIKLSVGHPAAGLNGFRASHREAVLARTVAGEQRVVRYDDVGLAALTSGHPEAVRCLVERELGSLARRDRLSATLRDTARIYLRHGASTTEAARILHTHRNTIRYRLSRFEQMRGLPLTERRLELEFALLAVDVLGELVLARD